MNSDKKYTRVEWIDFAKCIAIVLVIIGHVLSWYHPRYKAVYVAIYSMHMPFFFMLSGLTFRVDEEERVSDFIRYKAKKSTRSIASTSKIKSRLTAALVINSFESRPADLVTTVTDHPERTGRYHPYVSESLLRDIRSNHTVLGCLPLLFPQCCR